MTWKQYWRSQRRRSVPRSTRYFFWGVRKTGRRRCLDSSLRSGVRNLTEEVQSLHEDVSKLTRAVQAAQEAQQQTQEHLHIEEEKLSNVSKVNQKLSQQVDAVTL
eukprot:XP_017453638.1 PREDICTED: myosin-15-like isoform X2 [Rattus norvegicus]